MTNYRVFDGHCDTPIELWLQNQPLLENTLAVSLARAQRLGTWAQFFAFCTAWVEAKLPRPEIFARALDYFDAQLRENADKITLCRTASEAEAAMQYRSMAAAAQADGVSLTLVAGYQDADTRQDAYEARVQTYRDKRKSEEEAARLAATIQPAANANEHGTGYAADILSADDPQQDTSFAETRAYEWLTAYAAEYGFILRYPQDRQTATGIVFEPWHWRYVGVENALAIRASGLSLEEFIALQRAD